MFLVVLKLRVHTYCVVLFKKRKLLFKQHNQTVLHILSTHLLNGCTRCSAAGLEGFFAPHLQGRVFLIPDRTSSVEGWEPVYTRCAARYRFGTVSSVNFSFFQVPNTMQITTPNHIMLIKKNKNKKKNKTQIFYKQTKTKKEKKITNKFTIFSQTQPISNHKKPKQKTKPNP